MDPLNSEQRRRNMQANKATGSSSEIILAKALWSKGHRYRKNDKSLPGKPDITFKKLKIAIFTDGEFWHGKDWEVKRNKIIHNGEYWIKKIEQNIQRDKEIQKLLESKGWTVLRFWHGQIKKQLEKCVEQVEAVILQRNNEK